MKIYTNVLNFKGGILNINAFSDSHGQLSNIGDFYNTIEQNKNDLFLTNAKGTKNVVAIAGDWYMAGNVTGYLSRPKYNSQKFQLIFFNKLISELKHLSDNLTTLYSLGNHDFDAGFEEFEHCIEKMNAVIIATNIDFDNSQKTLKKEILKSYVIEIKDDKNPNLHHKALFLGVLPANMSYYNKELKGIKFLDNTFKPQSEISTEDIQKTLDAIKEQIKKFKKQYPNGAIILLDHFGGIFRNELISQKIPINIILGAHEHNDYEEHLGNTHCIMLSQNFKKLENIKIKFDDSGKISSIQTQTYYPEKSEKNNTIHDFFERIFKKDIKTNFQIPADDDIKELTLKGLRYENNFLANFITDVILNRIRKKYPNTDFFAINASAIRGELKTEISGSVNNLNILLTLNGIKNEDADILISKLTGEQILDIVIENLVANSKDKNRNPLMHYSGLKINKTLLLKSLEHGIAKKDMIRFLTKTDTNEPLELDKEYCFANVRKFFIKTKNPKVKEIYNSKNTVKTSLNAKNEFRKHFFENLGEVKAHREIRII